MTIHIDDLNSSLEIAAEAGAVTTLWVPSARLASHRVPLPSAPKRKWRELLPWLLEDRVLEPVDKLHFVMAGNNPDETLTVLVTAREQMESWIERANAAGLQRYRLLPDFQALPWEPGGISVARRGEQLLVRYSEYEGFAATPAVGWSLLENILGRREEARLWAALPAAEVRGALPAALHERIDAGHELDWRAEASRGTDLLTGDYTQARPVVIDKRALVTAALLLLALVISYGAVVLGNRNLRDEIAGLEEARWATVSAGFPGLNATGANPTAAVAEVIEGRFRQRESLAAPAMAMLTSLDGLVSACECQVEAIDLTPAGMELTLSGDAAALGSAVLPGYNLTVTVLGEGSSRLVLLREGDQ